MSGDGTDHTAVGFSGSLSSKMDDAVAREDACREYQSSLEDLTFNSKPHINMLTILAEENVQFAKDIVAIIEAQISKAPTMEKLPVLYLVDSIVKNVGGEYLAVFAKNLITSFICVFEKVDENTRKSLFKLRSTWDEVFPLKKLYALDVRVNSLDPAWPIKPLPSPTNAIHVNPKFLKQVCVCVCGHIWLVSMPASQLAPVISQSSLTQEQLIRQQLLAKQKQLLELQQKKIELELEQTKAQLMGQLFLCLQAGFISPAPTASSSLPKPDTVVRPWVPPQPQPDPKPSNRDPRLTRVVPPAAPQPKEQLAVKRESPALPPERRLPEKPTQLDKPGTRKGFSDDKSKSPSPLARSLNIQNKQLEAKFQKSTDGPRKDPRLKKRPQDKAGMSREDEQKKKRCSDKKDREEAPRGPDSLRVSKTKLVNGSVVTHDRNESSERPDFKTGGNARTHARKRTRSRSPAGSPKRKDRRSPKSKTRSRSPSPSHKPGKPQRIRAGDLQHGKPGRDERLGLKKNKSERRPKRLVEDHHSQSRDSPRSHEGGSKEAKEAHRWRSGWEENKHPKPSEDPHTKAGPQRHKSYSTPTRPSTPRNPKHRLSVDANLQIPEVLNSASKKDLLQRASRRLESGEISLEDFLNMAHQIKHFFQYQEEKQQRTKGWEGPGEFPVKKRSLLSSPPSAQSHPHEAMDPAELSYYEHKSKLRTTRVNHRQEANSCFVFAAQPVAPPENHFGQVDVNDLLSKLVSNGIIKPLSQVDAAPTPSEFTLVATAPPAEEEEEEEPEVEEDDFPDLTSFSIEHMKQRYESVVTKLYSGNQCCLCSMRFTTAQTDMYADHLDWHFRQNHAGKVASKKVTHRRWYYSLTDWIEFEEIADLEERAKSQFFEKENEEEVQKSQAAAKEKEFQSVRAAKDQLCEICQESFETYWVEEEEDWFLKNAIRVDEKNFHPACFEDYKNTSSYLDVTPSPSKLLTEHPLGTFLKMEEEKVTSCDVITVKQEVPSEGPPDGTSTSLTGPSEPAESFSVLLK
uniref:Pre-mRNA cleavage complex 2 protein Pcf11 n=1 Tax=Nothobranchius furzeri TaxID=105023 RepID=A0A8C6NY37_NOTFU